MQYSKSWFVYTVLKMVRYLSIFSVWVLILHQKRFFFFFKQSVPLPEMGWGPVAKNKALQTWPCVTYRAVDQLEAGSSPRQFVGNLWWTELHSDKFFVRLLRVSFVSVIPLLFLVHVSFHIYRCCVIVAVCSFVKLSVSRVPGSLAYEDRVACFHFALTVLNRSECFPSPYDMREIPCVCNL